MGSHDDDALLEAVREVFWTTMQVPVENTGQREWSGDSGPIAVSVQFDGDPGGHLTLGMDAHGAQRIASIFSGRDVPAESAACADALLELATMICGRATARIGLVSNVRPFGLHEERESRAGEVGSESMMTARTLRHEHGFVTLELVTTGTSAVEREPAAGVKTR